MEPVQATYLIDSYRFSWSEVDIVVDGLHESRGDLNCEMTVRTAAPFPGLLRQAKFNLSATRTRTEWIKTLTEREPEIDWYSAIEQACTLALRRWRDGSPFIDLSQVEPRGEDIYLLRPFVIEGAASGVFADGGTGKSLFALAAAVSVATGTNLLGFSPSRVGPVLYLDWEWDEEAHAERLQALGVGYGIEIPEEAIFYRREMASINEAAANIRAFIAAKGIVMVVVDSLGMARGGEPESAELTIKTFATMRTFGVPVLFVDHVAKHSTDKSHSFGSVYTRNSARLMWRMDAEEAETMGPKRIGLVNTKWNRRFVKARGLLLEIESDEMDRMISCRFDDCEPPLITVKTTGQRQLLYAVLKATGRAMKVYEIEEKLLEAGTPLKENVIRAVLSRYKDSFVSMTDERKVVTWGLLTKAIAE